METCIIACWDFIHDPDNIDTQPPFDDEGEFGPEPRGFEPDPDAPDEIEDEYVCPVHGRIDGGSECPRC